MKEDEATHAYPTRAIQGVAGMFMVSCLAASASGISAADRTELEDSARSVRPGIPGQRPFWNAPSHQFICAPAFDFKPVAGAKSYRFHVVAGGKTVSFEDGEPWASLAPVWTNDST